MKRDTGAAAFILFVVLAVTAGVAACEKGTLSSVDLLPASGEIDGWKRDGDPLTFYPENLWEYINGSAESFLSYDFRMVAAQDYMDAGGRGIKVEVYDHGSPLMAFGIYSQYRGPGVSFVDVGNEGFGDEYSLHFWKGIYYVKVGAFEAGGESARAMREFAGAVAAKIEPAGAVPFEAGCFPEKGLVSESVTYVTVGVLGRGKLPPAFVADYRRDDLEGQLFLFSLDTAEAAGEVFDWFAREIGAEADEAVSGGVRHRRAAGSDPYRGPMLTFQYGAWMGIAAGFGSSGSAREELLAETVARIARLEHAGD